MVERILKQQQPLIAALIETQKSDLMRNHSNGSFYLVKP